MLTHRNSSNVNNKHTQPDRMFGSRRASKALLQANLNLDRESRSPSCKYGSITDPHHPHNVIPSLSPRPDAALSRVKHNLVASICFLFIRSTAPFLSFLRPLLLPITFISTILAILCGFFTIFNLGEAFVAKYFRPKNWNTIRDFVARLNPKQRKLMAVDRRLSQLVDECIIDPKFYLEGNNKNNEKNLGKIQRPTKIVTLRETSKNKDYLLDPCVKQTSDVRYAETNASLRQANLLLYKGRDSSVVGGGGKVSSNSSSSAQQSTETTSTNNAKIPFQSYQLSSLWAPIERIMGGSRRIKYVSPLDTLREFNIAESDLNQWIENLRVWLSQRIFKPLVKEMKQVEQFLESKGWSHLSLNLHVPAADVVGSTTSTATTTTSNFPTSGQFGGFSMAPSFNQKNSSSSSSSMFGGGGGFGNTMLNNPQQTIPYSLNTLLAIASSEPLARSRVHLERYVFLSAYPLSIRRYVINRIVTLSQGDSLSSFDWNRGGKIPVTTKDENNLEKSIEWNTTVPSDAELILHVFSIWMDLQMPGGRKGSAMYSLFSSKYIKQLEDNKDMPDYPHIQVSTCHPPHFRFSLLKTVYDLFPKRNNVFSAICLFTLYSIRENSGYIDMLDITGNAIGLANILDL